jgi:hypothetical protein
MRPSEFLFATVFVGAVVACSGSSEGASTFGSFSGDGGSGGVGGSGGDTTGSGGAVADGSIESGGSGADGAAGAGGIAGAGGATGAGGAVITGGAGGAVADGATGVEAAAGSDAQVPAGTVGTPIAQTCSSAICVLNAVPECGGGDAIGTDTGMYCTAQCDSDDGCSSATQTMRCLTQCRQTDIIAAHRCLSQADYDRLMGTAFCQ